ncbi:MAG: hypothetical protein R3C40_07280 [Parvularculaceae bacterium]
MMLQLPHTHFRQGNGLLATMLFRHGRAVGVFSPVRIGAMPKYLRQNELVRGNGLCNAGCLLRSGRLYGRRIFDRAENGGAMVAAVAGQRVDRWLYRRVR